MGNNADGIQLEDELFQSYYTELEENDSSVIRYDDDSSKSQNIKDLVNKFNETIYRKTLIPQLNKNENQKRKHKLYLLIGIGIFIVIQILVLSAVIGIFVANITLDLTIFKDLNLDVTDKLLDFLKYYIGATVVEVLGILFFIVKNVYDTSIVDLFKDFSK